MAEAFKAEVILRSEAANEDQKNRAMGEAEAIMRRADATAKGLNLVSEALRYAFQLLLGCSFLLMQSFQSS